VVHGARSKRVGVVRLGLSLDSALYKPKAAWHALLPRPHHVQITFRFLMPGRYS